MNQIGSTTLEPMSMVVQECFMVPGSLTRTLTPVIEKVVSQQQQQQKMGYKAWK